MIQCLKQPKNNKMELSKSSKKTIPSQISQSKPKKSNLAQSQPPKNSYFRTNDQSYSPIPSNIKNPDNFLNSSGQSHKSNSSDNISSPKLNEILKKYSNTVEKTNVRSVFSKKALASNGKIQKRFTPVPEMPKNNQDSPKHPLINMLDPLDKKKIEILKPETNDSSFLKQLLQNYESIIRKQSKEIIYLKGKISKNVENSSKSISPTYARSKIQINSYGEFWNVKGAHATEPRHLYEIEGFKNLWICNMESKIINPANQFKKFPSNLLYRYKNSRK